MKQLFVCNDVKSKRKTPLFITLAGPEVYTRLVNLEHPDDPVSKSYDELLTLLKAVFVKKQLPVVEKFKRNSRDQPNESISEFIVAIRSAAKGYDYGEF